MEPTQNPSSKIPDKRELRWVLGIWKSSRDVNIFQWIPDFGFAKFVKLAQGTSVSEMTRVNINSREWNQSFNWSCRHMQRPQKEQLTPTHFTCAQALTRSRCDILYIYSVMQQIRDYVCCMLFSNNSDQVRFLKMMRHTTEAPEIESFALPATYGHYWLFHRAFSNQQWTQTSIGTIWITYINWHHLYLKAIFLPCNVVVDHVWMQSFARRQTFYDAWCKDLRSWEICRWI